MSMLKYRIVKYEFPRAKECYIAQYKILRIWMSIGNSKNYFFAWNSNTHCDTYEEAFWRIAKLMLEMKRSEQWAEKTKTVIYRSAEL